MDLDIAASADNLAIDHPLPAEMPDAPAGPEPARADSGVEVPPPEVAVRGVGPGRGWVNQWSDVDCPSCSALVGQIKYDPAPGSRDQPTWFMRVADEHGVFPNQGPLFRRRVARFMDEDGATTWVLSKKKCGCGA